MAVEVPIVGGGLVNTYTIEQVQEAQDHRPQIERFIVDGQIYIVGSLADYDLLPAAVQDLIKLRNSF